MATPVSVVIICCNVEATIQKTIVSAFLLTDDVVVVDSGSNDNTLLIIRATNAKLVQMEWVGFGANKNKGNEAAKWDWIVSLDADEVLSNELVAAIGTINFEDPHSVYSFHRLNYLGLTPINYGEWRNDWTVRLFHQQLVRWDDAPVHEELIIPPSIQTKKLRGVLHHYTAVNINDYEQKLEKYANLMAERYYAKGKKAPAYKIYGSPVFSFLRYYILQLGWMDGAAGWQISKAHAFYTFKKYKKLKELRRHKKFK